MGHCLPTGQKHRMVKTFTDEIVLSLCLVSPAQQRNDTFI